MRLAKQAEALPLIPDQFVILLAIRHRQLTP